MNQERRRIEHRPRAPHRGCATLVELARLRAALQPRQTAFVFLRDGETESERLDFGGLDAGARAVAASLQQRFRPGDRVLLSQPTGVDFIHAFFGCLYAGVLPVPAYPPTASTEIGRLERIAADCSAAGICVARGGFDGTRAAIGASPSLRGLVQVMLPAPDDGDAAAWQPPLLSADSLAFLQYTSGSTGAPKGVMVSHGNLLHNQRLIERAFGLGERSVGVSWLPLYHDMGLIGHVMQSLYLGMTTVLMSPVAFAARPARWLQAISDYRATCSGGPDFAYELCVQRVTAEQMVGLDLGHWKLAFTGAETVRERSLLRFAEKFSACGFHRNALTSCYGLAEATLFVSAGSRARYPQVRRVDAAALQQHRALAVAREPAGGTGGHAASDPGSNTAGDDGSVAIVGCGQAIGQEVAIVDPQTRRRCAALQVGEIWVRGASVARGYWNNPAASAATFGATLADAPADGSAARYLRTGDLGFVDGGELFVTGRVEDLMLIRGRHYYPGDIEAAVRSSHPALESGATAAFSIDSDGEARLVVAHEIHRHAWRRLAQAEVAQAARAALMARLGLPLQELVLLQQGGLPKTSSGKICRRASREAYLGQSLVPRVRPVAALAA